MKTKEELEQLRIEYRTLSNKFKELDENQEEIFEQDLPDWEECTAYIPKKQVHNYECGKVFPDREITNLELKTEFEEITVVRLFTIYNNW